MRRARISAMVRGLLEALFEESVSPVSYWGTDLRLVFANPAFYRLLGGTPETSEGRLPQDVLGPGWPLLQAHLPAVLRGETVAYERSYPGADGATCVTRVHIQPHLKDGVIVGFAAYNTDVTDARRAIERSDEKFARIFRTSPVGMLVRTLDDSRIVDANDAFIALYGVTRDGVIGKTLLEAGLMDEAGAAARAARVAADGPALRSEEITFRRADGATRVALVSAEPIDLGVPCVLGTFVDITERKVAERRLALQNAISVALDESDTLRDAAPRLLRTLCESEGWDIGTLWLVGDDEQLHCVAEWHDEKPAYEELATVSRALCFRKGEGLPGRVWNENRPIGIFPIADCPFFVRRDAALRAGLSAAAAFPVCVRGKVVGVFDLIDGKHPLDEQHADLMTNIGRQIGAFLERTEAADATRKSGERLRAVIDSLREGVVVASEDGRLVHWNPAALAMHGFDSQAEAHVSEFENLYTLSDLDGTIIPFSEWPVARMLRGESLRDVEVEVRRTDRDWARTFSYGGSLVVHPDGSRLVALTIHDITEQKRTAKLAEEHRRVRIASRLKSEFLANMSHELRTPLNAIIGFSTLLQRGSAGALNERQTEFITDVLTSSQHLLQLINDVLDLSKIEAGKQETQLTDVSLRELAKQVYDVVRGLAASQHVALSIDVADGIDQVRVDARMTKQILYNFASNAIKFTGQGGHVRIAVVREDDTHFRIDVVDDGIGIAPDDMKRLFVEFQQLDSGTTKRFQGTGLGLALSKRLAELQSGHVGAESALGEGSRFYVVLPMRVPRHSRSPQDPQSRRPALE